MKLGVFCYVLFTAFFVSLKAEEAFKPNGYVPVYVMLPLDVISNDGKVNNPDQLKTWFAKLKNQGNVDGVLSDVWWGLVEKSPKQYDWSAYQELYGYVKNAGLSIGSIMSFHRCGGNVGDVCNIPLPDFVLEVGSSNKDIFYKDSQGDVDMEYISLGADNASLFSGRTPVDMYKDYVQSFATTFSGMINDKVITQIQIGLGPAGELRYPSYQSNLWQFCGIGEFQCYDKFMLAALKDAATKAGHSDWGNGGPNNAGSYDDHPDSTGFFGNGFQNYASDYGQFFLNWYAGSLVEHGRLVMSSVMDVLKSYDVDVAAKIAGIHWWYFHPSHAAELTAGFKNDQGSGYKPLAAFMKDLGVTMIFTCFEMKDSEQSSACGCGPQELVHQTLNTAHSYGLKYGAENALPRYDTTAYGTIEDNIRGYGPIQYFSYLRLCSDLMDGDNWNNFAGFVNTMHNI